MLMCIAGIIFLTLGHAIDVSQRLQHRLWEWVSCIVSIVGVGLFITGAVMSTGSSICSYGQWVL